jgi:fatty acid desaturase
MNGERATQDLVLKDFSTDFSELRRVLNKELSTISYVEARKTLEPQYWKARTDLLLSLLLFGCSTAFAITNSNWFLTPLVACMIGASVHRISLFLHEGAHFNLAKSKVKNDLLTDLLVSPFVVTSVAAYRPGHMLHHRNLGTGEDPERSYQSPLNFRFLFTGFFGLRVLDVVKARESTSTNKTQTRNVVIPLIGITMYVSLLFMGIFTENWSFCVSLTIGVGCVFPLIGSLRQLLEHRAQADDFLVMGEFPLTRNFPFWPLGWLFGAAGFNRHLLHHWDPGVSYTRLRDLERLLAGSSAERVLEARNDSYYSVSRRIWR